ncbi:dihydropteroate synthase [Celeribacter arenosi]|uniref:Dihydropteroate synthase n=1 Tax=Celeribacter arenosi TaxID=792649 RepID=A0ABP7KAE3_9RHOB
MPKPYFRPLMQNVPVRPAGAVTLAGGWTWFTHVEVLSRANEPFIIAAADVPQDVLDRLTAPRKPVAGLDLSRPNLMGILNVTPDSFSDGGQFTDPHLAREHALSMVSNGADIIDIGGESTRPGADLVEVEQEIARTAPTIAAIRKSSSVPISIDTRKACVAAQALAAGASLVNDVSAFTFDPSLAQTTARAGAPVCLMHAQGDPDVMQNDPRYDDVLLDVYDFLNVRIGVAEAAGIPRDRIIVDPGIGFGKTIAHNLAILNRLSLFHGLGCAVLLGASRKKFIGTLGDAPEARDRTPGSIAVALAAVAQGVQIVRVHDIKDTKQALALWQSVHQGEAADVT